MWVKRGLSKPPVLVLLVFACFSSLTVAETRAEFDARREAWLIEEAHKRFDAFIELSEEEEVANKLLVEARKKEIEIQEDAAPWQIWDFAQTKEVIENSALAPALAAMPKGAVLHLHGGGAYDQEKLMYDTTYRPECYVWLGEEVKPELWLEASKSSGRVAQALANGASLRQSLVHAPIFHDDSTLTNRVETKFVFHYFPPSAAAGNEIEWDGKTWLNVVDLREQAEDQDAFDAVLLAQLVFDRDDRETYNPRWIRFNQRFRRVKTLTVWEDTYRSSFQLMLETATADGVTLIELRDSIPDLYEFDGTLEGRQLSEEEAAEVIREEIASFNDARDVGGEVEVLFTPISSRSQDIDVVRANMEKALSSLTNYDWVVGYDIVNAEDMYHSTYYYVDAFLELKDKADELGLEIPLLLHAGETDWVSTNLNILDAVLLNATRIGHGYALSKHPVLMDQVVAANGPAIEICPVSNHVLRLVDDLRNHPAVGLMGAGVPMVIAPDDPGVMGYGAHFLLYDWYLAFVSWELDLRSLKALAYNSLKYSVASPELKAAQIAQWESQWKEWISVVSKHGFEGFPVGA